VRTVVAGGGIAAESGSSRGTETATCSGRIGVVPIRSMLVRGNLWQVLYSSNFTSRAGRSAHRAGSSVQEATMEHHVPNDRQ